MKLSDYMAQFLAKKVNTVFVGNGGCVIHILDSLDRQAGIKLIPCENEQGASIAAEAYSRVQGNLGVAVATSGPGMINLMQGIACAYYDSIPVLYISGEAPTSQLKGDQPLRQLGFQEMDVSSIVHSITKYAILLTDPCRVRYELEKLVYMAKTGRPGPVLLDLPDDLQRAEINPEELESFHPEERRPRGISREIARMSAMIAEADRPVIIAGGGIKLSKTEQLAKALIRESGIPVLTTWATIDMFTEDFPGLIGNFGVSANRPGNFAIQTADLVISLGSRLDTHETGSNPATFAPKAKKIVIDIDTSELNKKNGMVADLKIQCDLRDFLNGILPSSMKTKDLTAWKKRIGEWRRRYSICPCDYYKQKEKVNSYVFMNELSKETIKGDIIITDAGGTLTKTMQGYAMRKEQTLFSAFNHSPMGYAFPAAIGAHYAAPDRNVICITGDGGMNMNIQELETYKYNKLPIKVFILNNGEYGIIKQTQDTWMHSRYVASDRNSGVGSPDFVRIAQAYGITTETINDHSELNSKIKFILAWPDGPVICNVSVQSGEQIVPKLVFGRTLEDLAPFLDRDELKKNLEVS